MDALSKEFLSSIEVPLGFQFIPRGDAAERYCFDTHFESGKRVAIHWELPKGDVTIFKTSADLCRFFCSEATILENRYGRDLCRTQVLLQVSDPDMLSGYFLANPIGNHHILFCGNYKTLFEGFIMSCPEGVPVGSEN